MNDRLFAWVAGRAGAGWPVVRLALLVAACQLATLALDAHPGGHGTPVSTSAAASRTWTFADEDAHLHGSFVSATADKVRILRDDGGVATIALQRLVQADQQWIARQTAQIKRLNTEAGELILAQNAAPRAKRDGADQRLPAPLQAQHFAPFKDSVKVRWDEKWLFVESNGIPDHPLMIGIRAWQQQVPLPQKYVGDNAWQIPLTPRPAAQPASAKNRFLRGAIALAVNGVPIFNPLNNRGDDAYLFGELDDYGGHCGRADDYHYHIAPVHLEKTVGKGSVIGYALDGYPIYGYEEPDGSKVVGLDAWNGHKDAQGRYHYHATKAYPYLNGGFFGEVTEREGQVDPQPRAQPVREYLPPLAGAKITDFKSLDKNSYELKYEVAGKPGFVRYTLAESGAVKFTFVDTKGNSTSETYQPRGQRPLGKPKPKGDRPPPPRPDEKRPPRDDPGPAPPKGKGPAAGEARKPWIAEHLAELDANQDGSLTRAEMLAEAARTFTAYDSNQDGKLVRSEYDRGGVKTALAGFVRGHAAEIDRDGDGIITKQELDEFAGGLFDKADRDRDGQTTTAEAAQTGPERPKPPR